VPLVAIRTPAVADGPVSAVADTPGELATLLHVLLADPAEREANRAAWDDYFAGNTVERQRAALLEAYGAAR
jgi:hypothetical protein